jgi:very-short-patch-repair endonuclease
VSRAQLEALGLERGAIRARLERARLHPLHRGVYAVGHARMTAQGRSWAAVLACGGLEAAVLSHRSLGRAVGAAARLGRAGRGHDAAPQRVDGRDPGHRSRTLDPLVDVVRHSDGLPVTTVTRTLIDLADVVGPQRLRRAVHRAEVLRMLDAGALRAGLDRLPGRRTRALGAILADLATREPDLTRSELEERFLALVERFRLPRPRVNARVAGLEVDFLWPAERLVAEADGAAAHITATAFERDRARDAALAVAGLRVVRFTWRRVVAEPAAVARTLRALLGAPVTPTAPAAPPPRGATG